jgi:hypothetical protein
VYSDGMERDMHQNELASRFLRLVYHEQINLVSCILYQTFQGEISEVDFVLNALLANCFVCVSDLRTWNAL